MKRGSETNFVLRRIAERIGLPASVFRTAGLKDKSAVTVQRVTCDADTMRRILALPADRHTHDERLQ